MYDVAYAPCPDYSPETVNKALRAALERVTDWGWLKPGMKVALKVNLLLGADPAKAATTHPAVVCALCDLLVERGAEVIVGDSPGGPWTAAWVERAYRAAGLLAVEEHGARLNRDFSETRVHAPEARLCKEFDATAWLMEADAVVDVCKLKTHGMMTLTAGVKNLFGAIPGLKKPEYHYRFPGHADFADMLIDVYERVAPVLTVCDAVVAMEGNGPNSGTPRQVGCLAAASNAHALDESLARLIGLDPMAVPTLARAKDRGLLPGAPQIFGQPETIPDFVIPQGSSTTFEGQGSAAGKLFGGLLGSILKTRPQLTPAKCVGCRECANICPAKAITMRDNKPDIDRKTCIRCFCCQEFCPKGALYVHRSPIARLLNKDVK